MKDKKTIIYQSSELNREEVILDIKETLKRGSTVVFPTETVYGIGGNALDPKAVLSIYKAKGRPSDNPLIIHIARKKDLYLYARKVSKQAKMLIKAFMPGPLTLIFYKKNIVPFETTGGLHTVAIRYPDHEVAIKVIKASGLPIAAPSANLSGRPSSTEFKHVYEDLNGFVDIMIDGGDSTIGIESTVVDVSTSIPVILRPGFITKEMIESVLGIKVNDQSSQKVTDTAKSPGMKYTHYKPKGEVTLLDGNIDQMVEYLKKEKRDTIVQAIICVDEYKDFFPFLKVKTIGSIHQMNDIARHIFSALRMMDEWNVDQVFIQTFSSEHIGYAVMNRLLKASGYQVVKLS